MFFFLCLACRMRPSDRSSFLQLLSTTSLVSLARHSLSSHRLASHCTYRSSLGPPRQLTCISSFFVLVPRIAPHSPAIDVSQYLFLSLSLFVSQSLFPGRLSVLVLVSVSPAIAIARSPSAWHDHWHCMSHVSPSSHVANYSSASRIVRPRTRTRTRLRARLEVITSHHIISLRVSKCGTTPNPAHVLVLVLVLVHVNTVLYHDSPRPYAYTYAPITALLRPPSTLYVV